MKFFKSKFFITAVAIALILVLIPSMMSIMGYAGILRSALKTVATPFEWLGSQAAGAINGFTSVFTEYDDLKKENAELRARVAELESAQSDVAVLREQNAWLRNYLDLKAKAPSMILTDATVIAREAGSYATVLTVNKGSIHGIMRQMPVITEEGVFGYVSECGLNWAKVVSIIETASSVGVYTERAGVTGVVEGDATLRENGYCVMTYIPAGADVKVGDVVLTSGGNSVYPSGLPVGTIVSITADEATRTLRAVIKPAIDFTVIDDVSRLMIITGYKTGGN